MDAFARCIRPYALSVRTSVIHVVPELMENEALHELSAVRIAAQDWKRSDEDAVLFEARVTEPFVADHLNFEHAASELATPPDAPRERSRHIAELSSKVRTSLQTLNH